MDRAFVARNEALLARLVALVDSLSDADLGMQLDDGWRITAALAHLAFWDRFAGAVLNHWATGGFAPSGEGDGAFINSAGLPDWLAAPAEYVRDAVITAAEATDRAAATIPASLFPTIEAAGETWAPHRHVHRNEHIEQIANALRAG